MKIPRTKGVGSVFMRFWVQRDRPLPGFLSQSLTRLEESLRRSYLFELATFLCKLLINAAQKALRLNTQACSVAQSSIVLSSLTFVICSPKLPCQYNDIVRHCTETTLPRGMVKHGLLMLWHLKDVAAVKCIDCENVVICNPAGWHLPSFFQFLLS